VGFQEIGTVGVVGKAGDVLRAVGRLREARDLLRRGWARHGPWVDETGAFCAAERAVAWTVNGALQWLGGIESVWAKELLRRHLRVPSVHWWEAHDGLLSKQRALYVLDEVIRKHSPPSDELSERRSALSELRQSSRLPPLPAGLAGVGLPAESAGKSTTAPSRPTDRAGASSSLKTGSPTTARGEQHGRAKLTEAQVLEIRASTEGVWRLAIRYGVDPKAIKLIRDGTTWRHLLSLVLALFGLE
jgi:hypothetical protein